jgi:hypothetical protein
MVQLVENKISMHNDHHLYDVNQTMNFPCHVGIATLDIDTTKNLLLWPTTEYGIIAEKVKHKLIVRIKHLLEFLKTIYVIILLCQSFS